MSAVIKSKSTPRSVALATWKTLVGLLKPADSNLSILPFIPRPIKWFLLLLIILNARSFPLIWHYRVFKPMARVRLGALVAKLRGREATRAWLTSVCPVDQNPFDRLTIYKGFSSPDDCDYNAHLSNSSYAKNMDFARVQACMDNFIGVFAHNVWMGLGASHYLFVKEIPANTPYEMRITIGGWDEKWLYLVGYVVSYTSKQKAKHVGGTVSPTSPLASPVVQHALSTLPANATLHCITITLYCFKNGRITVPPRVALTASGFGSPSKNRWLKLQQLRREHKMEPLIKGGYKDDEQNTSEMQDFWKLEEFEQERVKNMHWLGKIREGMFMYGSDVPAS